MVSIPSSAFISLGGGGGGGGKELCNHHNSSQAFCTAWQENDEMGKISVNEFLSRTICMHVHGRIVGTGSSRIPALIMKKGQFTVPGSIP
jgi:hypothetical protein